MKRMLAALLILLFSVCTYPAIYKCRDSNGQMVYSDKATACNKPQSRNDPKPVDPTPIISIKENKYPINAMKHESDGKANLARQTNEANKEVDAVQEKAVPKTVYATEKDQSTGMVATAIGLIFIVAFVFVVYKRRSKLSKTISGSVAPIIPREDALKKVRNAAFGFYFVGAMTLGFGILLLTATVFWGRDMSIEAWAKNLIAEAFIIILLALWLHMYNSRVASVLLFFLSSLMFVTTVMNRLGVWNQGGKNILLAAGIFLMSVLAVDATFKLHGGFSAKVPKKW